MFGMAGLYGPYVVAGIVLMIVLWPTERSGRRLLRRWAGPDELTPEQIAAAVRYLRHRRLLILPLLLLALLVTRDAGSPAGQVLLPEGGPIASILVALLTAEAAAVIRRPRDPVRMASLVRRRWSDLLPRWVTTVYTGLTLLAVALAVAEVAIRRWAERLDRSETYASVQLVDLPSSWWLLAGLVLSFALVCGVVWSATRRRADADERIDRALRTRSARVAVGLGLGWSALIALTAMVRIGNQYYTSTHAGVWLPMPAPPAPPWAMVIAYTAMWLALPTLFVTAWSWGRVTAGTRQRVTRATRVTA